MTGSPITRRDLLTTGGVLATGLVLGFRLPSAEAETAVSSAAPFKPNSFLQIEANGMITVWVARAEMGQGVMTTMPMLVAEELEADWATISVELALADPVYGRHQITNASRSMRESWDVLRRAGATAREMLVTAAAQVWRVDRRSCQARSNAVVHEPTGKRLSYGALAAKAATLPVPENVRLKDPKNFRLIGTPIARVDTPKKVDGTAIFGLDAKVPGMLYATILRCPVFGGTIDRCDPRRATSVPGVRRVVELKDRVGVVADSTWAALKGKRALEPRWHSGAHGDVSSAGLSRKFAAAVETAGVIGRSDGDTAVALAGAARQIEAVYELPFEAHACLEPLTCTADVRRDRCEIWAPTQTPLDVQGLAARLTGLHRASVVVHPLLLGGGFGRKQMDDYVADAVQLSKAVSAPVKITWTREDDLQHDYYRPASYHRLRGGLDSSGQPIAWSHRLVGPSSWAQNWEEAVARGEPWPGVTAEQIRAEGAREAMEGAFELPYAIPNMRVDYVMVNTPVPVGWWRSVYYSQNGFVNECFLDELATAGGVDPYQLRRGLLTRLGSAKPRRDCERWGGDGPIADRPCAADPARVLGVLDLAARKAGWGKPLRAGRAQGIACVPYLSCDTYVSQVAEVSVSPAGEVRVHRVVCAVDCGLVINPAVVEAQMEGAIAFGLTAALKGGITIERGRVKQGNFNDYPLLRMSEMPSTEVYVVPSTESPGGAGEAGVPPIAPAVCNAIFAATGKRIRRLPINPEELKQRT